MTASNSQTAIANRKWASAAIVACLRCGITDFFVAPGSRCTPLTIALANASGKWTGISIHQHFDERGLAFAAIGYGRATGRPGVFICTSGTAVANAFPAVIESAAEDIPFVLMTADRPRELRGSGSNQTIDQVELFGGYPEAFADLHCSKDGNNPSAVDKTIIGLLEKATHGPVHINCMFAEPFLDEAYSDGDLLGLPCAVGTADLFSPPVGLADGEDSPIEIAGGKTLVVASGCRREVALAAKDLAKRLGAPFMADVTSGLRELAYDLALKRLIGHEAFWPDTLVHIGRRIVSKRLLKFMEAARPSTYLHINETNQPIDPLHMVTDKVIGNVPSICERIQIKTEPPPEYLQKWTAVSGHSQEVLGQQFNESPIGAIDANDHIDGISEPAVAWHVAKTIPTGSGLFLGNSMPVREMDSFGFWESDRIVQVAANRGASGIDGTIASAIGFAHGLGARTTAIIGDLAALHDLNSLQLLATSTQPVVLIVINNDGGGIFHFLPIASQSSHFEKFYGTPHARTFGHAAAMFGLDYTAPKTLPKFQEVYLQAIERDVSTVIEVTTDRTANLECHQRILQRVSESLDKVV